MKNWKYYLLRDNNKETVGTLQATNFNEAYDIASRRKQLPIPKFKEIFGVELLGK